MANSGMVLSDVSWRRWLGIESGEHRQRGWRGGYARERIRRSRGWRWDGFCSFSAEIAPYAPSKPAELKREFVQKPRHGCFIDRCLKIGLGGVMGKVGVQRKENVCIFAESVKVFLAFSFLSDAKHEFACDM
ncbi:hypothetical protein BSKO_11361 [Bryopsis sp. KO-2023]|nr:hypothetical protein BSKO_11361 [Bryopsis sp. KO-2023]